MAVKSVQNGREAQGSIWGLHKVEFRNETTLLAPMIPGLLSTDGAGLQPESASFGGRVLLTYGPHPTSSKRMLSLVHPRPAPQIAVRCVGAHESILAHGSGLSCIDKLRTPRRQLVQS